MTLSEWLSFPMPASKWRMRARSTMRNIVRKYIVTDDEDIAGLMALVDKAYPFGERANHPYKAWLEERRILSAVWENQKPDPTPEEFGACEVALDIMEQAKALEAQATLLLVSQAPNRLNRSCPVCSAKQDEECWDLEHNQRGVRRRLIVPHLTRVMVNRLGRPS